MNYFKLLVLLLGLALVSCSDGDEKTCTDVTYSTEFTVASGSSYCFPDGIELAITTLNNEFCPCNVECIWEGQMTIDMVWTLADGTMLDYKYLAAPQSQVSNEPLPDGMIILADQEDIVFDSECTQSNPSPVITQTVIQITK